MTGLMQRVKLIGIYKKKTTKKTDVINNRQPYGIYQRINRAISLPKRFWGEKVGIFYNETLKRMLYLLRMNAETN